MKVTVSQLNKSNTNSKVLAYCSLLVEDAIVINDIRLINGSKGLFIAFPSKKGTHTEFVDVVHPISTDVRRELTELIINAYNEKFPEEAK